MDPRFSFLVYVVDSRPLADVMAIVEQHLGCTFTPDDADVSPSLRANRFEGHVFGLEIGFSHHLVRETACYAISGATARRFDKRGMTMVAMDAHVVRMSRAAGFTRVMTPEDFARWDLDPAKIPTAASEDDAIRYMEGKPCAACATTEFSRERSSDVLAGTSATVYSGDCKRCGAYRHFVFRMTDA